jgi:tRNA/tmRNA/rRNA uracil-C5-methylase (TrmA/RlmC/RlmD family)
MNNFHPIYRQFMKDAIHCVHFERCSGCQMQNDLLSPPVLEQAKAFFAQRGIADLSLVSGAMCGWRCRSKLAVRGTAAKPLIGLFKQGTHQVEEIPHCQVHHPAINSSVSLLKNLMVRYRVEPYNETSGILRYIQCAVEPSTSAVQLTLVVNSDSWESPAVAKAEQLIDALVEEQPEAWQSIWINLNSASNNRIFGDQWRLFYGERFLWTSVCGTEICFLPSSFGQANLELFDAMVAKIGELIPEGASVLEYYGGVGAISLPLAVKARKIQCVEINPETKICFDEAREHLPADLAKRASHWVGSSGDNEALRFLEEADVVIVDPPRKGLDRELLERLKVMESGKQLIYVSCGWSAFERDADELLAAGWKMTEAVAYLFFPGTDYIEVLAGFRN